MKTSADVERWFAVKKLPAEPTIRRVQEIILRADRRITEFVKYGTLTFGYDGDFATFVQVSNKKQVSFKPYVLKPPITIGIEWNSTTIAETCSLVPDVKKTSSRSTEYKTDDWPDAMKVLVVQLLLALEVSGGKGIYQ